MSIFNIFKTIQRTVRRYFRRRMMPMSVDEAEEKREFFAKIYFLSSLGVLVCAIYSLYKKKIDNDASTVPIAERTIENIKLDGKIRIITFEGFKKTQDYYYPRKKDEVGESETNSVEQKQNSDSELIVESILTDETRTF